ncbi:ABC transporter ATP-binding protein [Janibacter limosus]|uniref:ATP-binding cassette domain-containing protein n=1 Tax=Janibacter limosus TaxID=53458 RepID=A0A4P6MU57_9MICO|nr:ATP-binding cassette domain-containing protein [Janibacter limosus]QBF45090.1 ATP-binding cassette domain-containing protein [Janibacter limosus]
MRRPQSDALEIDGLTLAYGGTNVLEQATARFAAEITCVVGTNGAGKSTLLRALATLIRPGAGSIRYGEVDVWGSAAALRDYRAQVGWVPQEIDMPGSASVIQVLRYAAWLKELPRQAWPHAEERVLSITGLGELAGRPVGRLSGGQRRRVMLAAALISTPRIVLLDEPTVGLDSEHRTALYDALRLVAQESIVVLSTHLLEDLASIADVAIEAVGGGLRPIDAPNSDVDVADRAAFYLRRMSSPLTS